MVGGDQPHRQGPRPASYDATKPTALVINFHGYTSNGISKKPCRTCPPRPTAPASSSLTRKAPARRRASTPAPAAATPRPNIVDDIGLTRAIIAEADSRLCLDGKRIFVTGFSNGGFMSHRIACELADLVAAIAPVSGVLGIPAGELHAQARHLRHPLPRHVRHHGALQRRRAERLAVGARHHRRLGQARRLHRHDADADVQQGRRHLRDLPALRRRRRGHAVHRQRRRPRLAGQPGPASPARRRTSRRPTRCGPSSKRTRCPDPRYNSAACPRATPRRRPRKRTS